MLVNPELYEGSACYDPNSVQERLAEDSFSHTHVPNYNQTAFSAAACMEVELQQQLNMEMDQNNQLLQEMHDSNHVLSCDHQQPNWEMNYNSDMGNVHLHQQNFVNNNNSNSSLPNMPYPPTQDLLNLFHLPSSSISFANPNMAHESSNHVLYDPLLPLNLPPQPPFFRELLNSLPHGYNLTGSRSGSLFGEVDMEREVISGDHEYHDGDGVFEFGREINVIGKGRDGKDTKHFATEKHRREQLNDKFKALKELVPNPTKPDRASVVGDAIEYINELKRTVDELKILVERKRCSRGRMKRCRTGDESTLDVESINTRPNGNAPEQQAYNGSSSLRSSWLQRKSKNTEVDVRIIDDEVTIKLVQQKRINCLLFVSKVLDELQLDLHHVAGGLIGNFYSFLFNTKIYEGSSVYASAIANKLIEAVDRQYAAIPASSNY